MSQSKKKTALKWANNITTGILFAVLAAMMLVVISTKASGGEPELFGYQLRTVLSGSMEPSIQTGSLIAIETIHDKSKLEKGDVITFRKNEDMLVTHRIIDVNKDPSGVSYQTKGDNNDGPDPEPVMAQNVVGKYSGFTLPYVGYFISFSQSKNGALLLLIPGIILFGYSMITIWKALSQIEAKESNNRETE
ncbi:MAG TPA: signal peptidase I [Lentibacillus sp.]|uniref:signal peptidase I SipW n=1 Tax=Lentibacillus sp. TaxID=1925746 RepID=UPI002B4B2B20|nr:signal peptidase I [Lentibacillus sp.]HLR63588.1 signal peptidase I [Lentibacillus sp.]